MKKITIDIETRSDIDINKCGVYKYVESENFDVLIAAVSIDNGDVKVYDLINGECFADEILQALCDTSVIKYAFNVNFERICLSEYIKRNYPELWKASSHSGRYLSPYSWRCDMIRCRYLGLPSSLEAVGKLLRLKHKKLETGKELIEYFCVPYRNNQGYWLFNEADDNPEAWEHFKEYNKRDVETEMEIQSKLLVFNIPDSIMEEFYLDQMINDRGILVDMRFVQNAVSLAAEEKEQLLEKLIEITGLDNPNSPAQMKEWLALNDVQTEALDKNAVGVLLDKVDDEIKEALLLYQQISKNSVKKYETMLNVMCDDNRVRGTFSFYGASRTGRFAGRLVQLQNLPQNHLDNIAEVKELVSTENFDEVRKQFSDVTDTLSQLIRTSFVPPDGKKYIVCDFSAIEARVLAWLAAEEWRMEAFRKGEDIYCASASAMFGVPVEKNGINGHLRQKGKVAELACGYGGGLGAIKKMGGADLHLTDSELTDLVNDWRRTSPNIKNYWNKVDTLVEYVINSKSSMEYKNLSFSYENGILFIRLPSGRSLSYVGAKIELNSEGKKIITFGAAENSKKFSKHETYGAKIVENITQGVARDLLLYSMHTLRDMNIVAHVHDEVIVECNKDVTVSEVCSKMEITPNWAEGLLLHAEGYECNFYMKA